MEEDNSNYNCNVKKFVGAEVVVVDDVGTHYRGVIKAINFMHLNVILINESGNLVIVRNVRSILKQKQEQKRL